MSIEYIYDSHPAHIQISYRERILDTHTQSKANKQESERFRLVFAPASSKSTVDEFRCFSGGVREEENILLFTYRSTF